MTANRRPDPETARREFDEFVAATAESLLRAVYLVVWDGQEAEDLLQECYLRLARRWPRVRRMENPRAYARKILVNLALDARVRRQRRNVELGQADSRAVEGHQDPAAGAAFGRIDAGTDLEQSLGTLTPRQRAVLVLRFLHDLSEAQVADLMGCSVGTVKSTTSRALEHLRSAEPEPLHHVSHQDPERSLPR